MVCVQLLRTLDIPVDQWDTILVFHVAEKLDRDSRQQWELSLKTSELPTFQALCDFIDQRTRALQTTVSGSARKQIKAT